MRFIFTVLSLFYAQCALARVCSIHDIPTTPGFKFQKLETPLRFQVDNGHGQILDFELVKLGQQGAREIYLFMTEQLAGHHPRFMTYDRGTVTFEAYSQNELNCDECETAGRLLLHKKGKPQKAIALENLNLPFCTRLEWAKYKLQRCQLVPTPQNLKWQKHKGTKFFPSTFSTYFQIPKSEFSYDCSSMFFHEGLKVPIPEGYMCERIRGPALIPYAHKDQSLPKDYFQIESRQLESILENRDFQLSPSGTITDHAFLAKAYGEFCKRNRNCQKGWKGNPLLIGADAGYGIQYICISPSVRETPSNFCETKEDCIWAPDCCSRFPANKHYRFQRELCPAVTCQEPKQSLRLECQNKKCVGVAQ